MKMSISAVSDFSETEAPTPTTNNQILTSRVNVTPQVQTAIVYCEGQFGALDGKTANGLVRHSEKYQIISVIDSQKTGLDAGKVLDNLPNGIPICESLAIAIQKFGTTPAYFIFGLAPASGMLSAKERSVVLEAVRRGINIVSGLHEFLNDDTEIYAASVANNVRLFDIRKPPAKKDLRVFSGQIKKVTCPRIAILGTDCAIGKRTTATILNRLLNDCGLKSVMIGTGQTGLMQGARYGIALDAIPSQFCCGELEATVIEAFEMESPDVIIVEGQGALSHPAYSTSSFILRGSCPDAVILQHAPGRFARCDFPDMVMPTPHREINLIQTFSNTKVIGVTINHENLCETEADEFASRYEREFGIPSTDPITKPERLLKMVFSAFPQIGADLAASV
jgi:uncharacterized NAD-dependent epimerase/dehydratase family protein